MSQLGQLRFADLTLFYIVDHLDQKIPNWPFGVNPYLNKGIAFARNNFWMFFQVLAQFRLKVSTGKSLENKCKYIYTMTASQYFL